MRSAALEKKGEAIAELDVAAKTILADRFLIVTGKSKIQTRAIADNISQRLAEDGLRVARVEGYADGNWILLDLGNLIVHIFTPEQRAFYNLERLWAPAHERSAKTS